jgi:hypothetical protein
VRATAVRERKRPCVSPMFDKPQTDEPNEPEATTPEFHTIRSKYEFVMACAKEAERLNDRLRNNGIRPNRKVTVDAIDRVKVGHSKITYSEPQAPPEESPRETTYFFGS